MGIGGFIDFLTGRPHVEVPLLILVASALIEIVLLLIFCRPKDKKKAMGVVLGANLLYVIISEIIFKILYGIWFTSGYQGGPTVFIIRLICSLLAVLAIGNVFLKKDKDIVNMEKVNIVLGIGIVAAALLSVRIEDWFFMIRLV